MGTSGYTLGVEWAHPGIP